MNFNSNSHTTLVGTLITNESQVFKNQNQNGLSLCSMPLQKSIEKFILNNESPERQITNKILQNSFKNIKFREFRAKLQNPFSKNQINPKESESFKQNRLSRQRMVVIKPLFKRKIKIVDN